MLSSGTQTKPLTESALRQAVNRVLDKGFIRESMHSEDERAERNISDDDIRYGLERKDWSLAKQPDFDSKHKTWEYLIKTLDVDQVELHLKIVIYPDENRIKVITKY